MQFDPHHLSALAAVLRLGSFEAAAADLSVTPSAISQRIKALEEKVGASLINRGTPCTGTPQGARIAKHAEDVGLLESQLSRELSLETTPGPTRIRIAVNADSLATWFVNAMVMLPDLLFDLVIDDQDHSADWLKRGDVSAAICAGDKPVAGCDMHPLGALRYVATASPGYMRKWFPDGVTPATLSRAPCMVFNAKDGLQRQWIAEYVGPRIAPPSHYLPSTHAFVDAARAGIGWGMNPVALVRGPVRNGKLVPLLKNAPLDVPLNWQISRVMAPALEPLTNAVKKAASKGLVKPE
ncbi:LysR family transcriptional regulator ArgP [Falsiphaeobacter marinintestinus]|uniref:LysR family transcriptional regulator ArgP n=1 Tax=Falsiphaeobacter marinintestinus TaxID=1492905 RepID=UPI0011B4F4F5|nr:LysR family transcriptional regulator ArgP [Phaeobacter marinintestinus]